MFEILLRYQQLFIGTRRDENWLWRSDLNIAVGARGLGFDSRAGQIGHYCQWLVVAATKLCCPGAFHLKIEEIIGLYAKLPVSKQLFYGKRTF